MKRIALLVVVTSMALLLFACGDNAEKKVETKAVSEMDKSKLNEASNEVNAELTDGIPATKQADAAIAPATEAGKINADNKVDISAAAPTTTPAAVAPTPTPSPAVDDEDDDKETMSMLEDSQDNADVASATQAGITPAAE